ncbi:MAG: alpha/beta hydrolase [Bacteriovoracaceae bacterium]|nr:alpha/beta hydrolase [Bacteriovoracaceae bacterium]
MEVEKVIIPEDLNCLPDLEYLNIDGHSLKLDIVTSKENKDKSCPCIVWIHGGGWRFGDKKDTIHRLYELARAGYVCVSINYRLTDVAIFPAQLEDCREAIKYLKRVGQNYKIDPDRIGVWGGSAGGHLAALLGTDIDNSAKVDAVCTWFGAFDLLKMDEFPDGVKSRIPHLTADSLDGQLVGGDVREVGEIVQKANPSTHITGNEPPFLIMHGAKDDFVPYTQSVELHKLLLKNGVNSNLHIIKEASHNGIGFYDHHIRLVKDFFDWHLR